MKTQVVAVKQFNLCVKKFLNQELKCYVRRADDWQKSSFKVTSLCILFITQKRRGDEYKNKKTRKNKNHSL